jgi:hypothetical protein
MRAKARAVQRLPPERELLGPRELTALREDANWRCALPYPSGLLPALDEFAHQKVPSSENRPIQNWRGRLHYSLLWRPSAQIQRQDLHVRSFQLRLVPKY